MKRNNARKPAPSASAQPRIQGEGDFEAARRWRDMLERFVRSADIERAARAAAP